MKILFIIFVSLATIAFPLLVSIAAPRDVVINEIAWMGTQASASDEWIELYNNTQSAIDLSGWTLSLFKPATTTPAKVITLSGIIATQGFYLIERTNDTTVLDITADLISSFGMGLVDSGMILQLTQNGAVVDRTPELCDNKWCAGSNTPKMSMERIRPDTDGTQASNWATNDGVTINGRDAAGNPINATPKSKNSVFVSVNTSGSSGSAPVNSTTTEVVRLVPTTSYGVPLPPQPTFTVNAGEDRNVLAGALIEFFARSSIKNDTLQSFRYTWNFGDGTTKEGRAVNHLYLFPGDYTISVSMASDELAVTDFSRISVTPPLIIFSEIKPGENGFVELYNAGKMRIDAGGLMITDEVQTFTIPKNTYLDAGGVLVLANAATKIMGSGNTFFLNTANGIRVDTARVQGTHVEKESFVRSGDIFIKIAEASPGIYKPSPEVVLSNAPAVEKKVIISPQTNQHISTITSSENNNKDSAVTSENRKENTIPDSEKTAFVSNIFSKLNGTVALGLSIILGIVASIGFIVFKRFL